MKRPGIFVMLSLAWAFQASAQTPPAGKSATPPAGKAAAPAGRGAAGATGQTGSTGSTGSAASKGATAATGSAGAQGASGARGGTAGAAPQSQGSPAGVSMPAMTLQREVFTYTSGGRRDPMVSLMKSGDIRPLITELKVIAIKYDETGSNHSAVLVNVVDKKTQYRVRVGQTLGRMKVAAITRNEVVFTIQEFGMDRTERLPIKPDTARKQ